MEISFYFFFREWKLIFKNSVNRNLKKLTVVKKAKILIVNRKIHNPIETLGHRNGGLLSLIYTRYGKKKTALRQNYILKRHPFHAYEIFRIETQV